MLKNRVKRHRTIKRLVKRPMKDLTHTASEQLELTEELRSVSETDSDENLLSHSLPDHCVANTAECSGILSSRVTDDTSSISAVNDSDSHSSNLVAPTYLDFCYSEPDEDVMSTESDNTQSLPSFMNPVLVI